MRKVLIILFILFSSSIYAKTEVDKAFAKRTSKVSTRFTLYSPEVFEGKSILQNQVFNGFECKGNNISPKLVWKNPPKNTKSFAITMYDKDAKTGSGWWHWIVYNIPSDINIIERGAGNEKKLLPKGSIIGKNDFGENSYGGVCPPSGETHNYTITLYSLSIDEINLPKDATPAMVGLYLNKYAIKKTAINSYYKNKPKIIYKENKIKDDNKIVYKKAKNADKNTKKYKLKNTDVIKNDSKKSNKN